MKKTPKQKPVVARPVAQTPSEEAFNELLLRNKGMLWHICSDYSLGKAWNPEDCMQEVIYVLWRDFHQFEGRSSERTWVYRVATNAMLMLRRKYTQGPVTESIDGQEEEHVDMAYSENESYQQLLQLIDALPEKERVVVRAHLDGFSYKEIARMNDTTVGAVAMRIARLKKHLRRLYEKENAIKNK